MFEITKHFRSIEISYCELSEIKEKRFLKKSHKFTNNSSRNGITWTTRNIWSLFLLKDKSDYKSCDIYKGDCPCGSGYIGKTKRNTEVRWNELNNAKKFSAPSKQKQLWSNINHCFTWTVFSNAPKMLGPGRTFEIFFSAKLILTNKRILNN